MTPPAFHTVASFLRRGAVLCGKDAYSKRNETACKARRRMSRTRIDMIE